MKKKICLVIVVYPGKLKTLKKLIKNFRKINFVVYFNNFKKKPVIRNIQHSVYLNENILKSRVLMIKGLKNLDYDYFIFHDIDDKFNFRRYKFLPSFLDKYDFVINDLNINNKKKYFSSRLRNNQKLYYKNIKNYNFAGMSNSACTKKIIKKIRFYRKDYSSIIFDWMFWSKIFKIGNGIFTNKVITQYNASKNRPTFLPSNFNNKKHVNFIKKVRKKHGLKNKHILKKNNNFWWEM